MIVPRADFVGIEGDDVTERPGSPGKAKGKGKGKEPGKRPSSPSQRITGTSPSGKANRPPCRDWAVGECPRGNDCDYYHPKGICKFFQQGNCMNGKKCGFRHIKPTAAPAVDADKAEAKAKAKGKAKLACMRRPSLPLVVMASLLGQSSSIHTPAAPQGLHAVPKGLHGQEPQIPGLIMNCRPHRARQLDYINKIVNEKDLVEWSLAENIKNTRLSETPEKQKHVRYNEEHGVQNLANMQYNKLVYHEYADRKGEYLNILGHACDGGQHFADGEHGDDKEWIQKREKMAIEAAFQTTRHVDLN